MKYSKYFSASLHPRARMVFIFILFLQGCGGKAPDAQVLATVNGSDITQADLEQMLDGMLGERAAGMSAQQVREKALEGLVMMRAIAMRQENDLDAEQLTAIEIKTRHYRDELLVESYLRGHARPYTPTEADIREYYERHAEHFGAGKVFSYEILQANAVPAPERLPQLIKQLDEAKQQADWRQYAGRLKQQGQQVVFVQGRTDGPPLHANLSQVIENLDVNQVSNVFYLDKKPHIARIVAVDRRQPRPLDEVRGEIRKALAVQHMKTAIAEASEEVMKSAKVHYNSRRGAETLSENGNE